MKKIRFQTPASVREAAAQLLYLALHEQKSARLPLQFQQLAGYGFDQHAKRQVTALVYGVMTKYYSLLFILQKHSKKETDSLDPWLKIVLLQALWELRWSTKPLPAAICDESCKLVSKYLHQGAVGFINAILRQEIRKPVVLHAKNLAQYYSLPTELAGLFKKWFGLENAQQQLSALEQKPDLTIRTNSQHITPLALKNQLEEEGIAVEPSRFMPQAWRIELGGKALTQLTAFQDGLFFVQGEGAMLPVHLVRDELRQAERVLDVCAAPGGKTSQIVELLPDDSLCIAQDSLEYRLAKVEENFNRLRLKQACLRLADAAEEDYPQAWQSGFDFVFCDVPCSGLGLIGRKPDIRMKMTYERIQSLLPIQKAILQKAAGLVRPGGYLVYSTCTLNPDENEGQLQQLFASPEGQSFERQSILNRLPEPLLSLLTLEQKEEAKRGCLTLLPANCLCEGFFIALLKKKM